MRRDVSLLPTFLVTVDNIKSYMNQVDHLFYFINRRLTLKGVLEQIMPSYITPSKIRIRHIRIAFQHTSCIQESFRTGIKRYHTFGANFYANAFFGTGCNINCSVEPALRAKSSLAKVFPSCIHTVRKFMMA